MLLPRDVGKKSSWWFAIPGVSPFIKSLTKGRSAVQQMVKRSKFSELLWSELESRRVGVSKLSVEYHIHDLVGRDQLERYVILKYSQANLATSNACHSPTAGA